MNKKIATILILIFLLWEISFTGSIVSIFYCMFCTPSQMKILTMYTIMQHFFCYLILSSFAIILYMPVEKTISDLNENLKCSDERLLFITRRNNKFAINISIIYALIVIFYVIINYLLFSYYGIDSFFALSIIGVCISCFSS